ncbi:MAG: hypothetical protein P8J87_21410, partial [Verrucomicrobiales bacterium]|nr:hypothetical protein [Verrucomicrobiales bacterium]
MIRPSLIATALLLTSLPLLAKDPYGHFLEHGFPFLEATVDARDFGGSPGSDNLAPRALVLRLASDTYAAFDTDLLRLSVAWHGGFLEPDTIAMRSYQQPKSKMGGGQKQLSRPIGTPITATGLYPGWHIGSPDFTDPRPTTPDPRELGRGPLPESHARYQKTSVYGPSATLHYTVGVTPVAETISGSSDSVTRHVEIGGNRTRPIHLYAGDDPTTFHLTPQRGNASLTRSGNHHLVTVPASSSPVTFTLSTTPHQPPAPPAPATPHWPQKLNTSTSSDGPIDHIALPVDNPWQRNVRPSGITFAPDGTAYICTYDGDVYKVTNLTADLRDVSWRRIASGFNEPTSLAFADNHVHVFSRGGLTRLVDSTADGETDHYELLSNNFTQSADTRDYAHDMAVSTDGTFHLVKGGQQDTYRARHSGRLLDISNSSAGTTVHATGFRNAYIGLDPATQKLYACDQQGHWVPTTPVYEVIRGGYYGFAPARPLAQPEPTPESPLVWLPHRTCQSAVDIVPGNGQLHVVDYFRPGIVRVLLPSASQPHAAAIPLDLAFSSPLLKAATNPKDGHIYLVGFQVWGSIARDLAGFCRFHPDTVAQTKPTAASPYSTGVH